MGTRKQLSRRDFLRGSLIGVGVSLSPALLAACSQAAQPAVSPTTAAAPVAPTVAPTVAATAPAVATAAPPDPLSLVPADALPGSPTHARGWTTTLPQLPQGFPLNPPQTFTTNFKTIDMKFARGDTLENNIWSRFAEPLTGVKWEYTFTTSTPEEEQQKWQLALASGEVPDMMSAVQPQVVKQLLDADMLEDITDIWEAVAPPEIKAMLDRDNAMAWQLVTKDGRRYGIPYVESAGQNDKVLWIRQDWLDTVGLPIPTTLDELGKVAKAFVDAKLGGPDTIGINASNQLTTWICSLDPVFAGFGAMSRLGDSNCWIDQGGKLVSANTVPGMKDALALLRQWYADGLLRQDFYTVDAGGSVSVIGANQCGIFFGPFWCPNWPLADSVTNDPKAKWVYAEVPAGSAGVGKLWSNPYNPIPTLFRKGFAGTADAIKYMIWTYELGLVEHKMRGWEGYTYEWTADDKVKLTEINKEWFTWSPTRASFNKEGFYETSTVEAEWEKLPKAELDAWQEMKLEDPAGNAKTIRGAYQLVAKSTDQVGIRNRFTALPTEAMVANAPILNPLEDEVFFAIITGQQPLEAFDQYVQDWLAGGGAQMTEEANAWYSTLAS